MPTDKWKNSKWQEVLGAMLGAKVPKRLKWFTVSDEDQAKAQDWIGTNNVRLPGWFTCIGVAEAAAHIVEEAIGNDNFEGNYD